MQGLQNALCHFRLVGRFSHVRVCFRLAQSVDVEGTITDVSTAELTISLNDGKVYQAPSEFNFEGLESGVKVWCSTPRSMASG
jgi:hypothetical protein